MASGGSPTMAMDATIGRHAGIGWAAVGALLFLLLALALTLHWDRRRVFDQHDVLFDTDTKSRLGCYAHGWVGHGRNTVHPNLCNLVNPPIRALSMLAPAPERLALRERMALWVSPMAGAVSLFCALMALARVGVRGLQRALLGAVLAIGFGPLFFSSMPDHFALGAMTIAIALWLFCDRVMGGPARRVAWLLTGWLTASITLTNLVPVVALFLLAGWHAGGAGRGARAAGVAIADAVLLGLMAVLTAYGSAWVLNLGYGIHGLDVFLPTQGGGPYKDDVSGELLRYPLRVLGSFAPSGYDLVPNALSLREGHHYEIQFEMGTYPLPAPAGWLMGALLLLAVTLRWRQRGAQRVVLLGLLMVLVFHGLLHARIGNDYFLYSSHWAVATVLLLALPERDESRRFAQLHLLLLALLAAALLVNTATLLKRIDVDLNRHRLPWTEVPT